MHKSSCAQIIFLQCAPKLRKPGRLNTLLGPRQIVENFTEDEGVRVWEGGGGMSRRRRFGSSSVFCVSTAKRVHQVRCQHACVIGHHERHPDVPARRDGTHDERLVGHSGAFVENIVIQRAPT